MSEPDPFRSQLSTLAPAVDMPASRELFERSRATAGATRRWLLPAAVITLLLAGVLGVWALARGDGATTVPIAPIDGEQLTSGFDVLAIERTASPPGSIQRATNSAEFEATMALLDEGSPEATVDFEASTVAVFNAAGNECPRELTGFDVDSVTWSPRFAQPTGSGCDDVAITWAYVVAFDRSLFASMVRFRMPDDILGAAPVIDEPELGSPFEWIAVE